MFGVETGREVRGRGRTWIGFAKEQCFQFRVKEVKRAMESWQGERVEVVRRMGQIFVEILAGVCSKKVDSYGYGAIGKFK